MPVEFLTKEQRENYGRYAAEPNDVQLARYFHLDENDLALVLQRRGDQNRLGIALQLTSARFLGAFLADLTLVPKNVQLFVARQLSISSISILTQYARREPTKWEHYAQIKKH